MTAVLVFGSVNVDFSLRVPSLPRPGETVMATQGALVPGGKGANQAHAAKRYGASVQLVGAVGDDALADVALGGLRPSGVALGGVRRLADHPTGLATVHVNDAGENAIAVVAGANAAVCSDWVDDAQIDACKVLLLQWELSPSASMALARRARARGAAVLLNLAPARSLDALQPALLDWLLVNQTELALLCDHLDWPGLAPEAAVQALAGAWGCAVLVTLGAAGAVAGLPDGHCLRVPALPVRAVDSTGAGDTFCGVFAAALALGEGVDGALRSAAAAASLSCTQSGAQAAQPARDEVLSARRPLALAPVHPAPSAPTSSTPSPAPPPPSAPSA